MYYKEFFKNHQLPLVPDKYIKLESSLTNFFNVETTSVLTKSDKLANCIELILKHLIALVVLVRCI